MLSRLHVVSRTPFAALIIASLMLSSCDSIKDISLLENGYVEEAKVTDTTRSSQILAALPEPMDRVPLSVYEFQDQTGQFKPNERLAEYSSAVTKGGLAVLTKALLDSGNRKWFMVAERGGLRNLLQERQIIRTMRDEYRLPNGGKLNDLPPMVYSGIVLEGGIVFYDSNTITGGASARYFGIGANTEYRRDIVTVYLRAVSVQTGEVILSVTSSKTVFSYALTAGFSRYLSIDKLLETEAGYTVNEPSQLAVRQAIETAVYSMIMEGSLGGFWQFKDPYAGKKAINEYLERRDGIKKDGWFASDNKPDDTQVKQTAQPAPVQDAPIPQPAPLAIAPQPQPLAAPSAESLPEYNPQAPAQAVAAQPQPAPAEPAPQMIYAPAAQTQQPASQATSASGRPVPANSLAAYYRNREMNGSRYEDRRGSGQ